MIGIHSVEEIRAAEQAYSAEHPDDDLMQIAAQRVSTRAEQMVGDERGFILVAVGPGHNGGDGLYAARNLARAGRRVVIWLVTGKANPMGVVAARQAGIRFIDAYTVMRMLPDVALVIDAIIGLGARPGLPEQVDWFAEACVTLGIPTLSIDLPSGLTADDHRRPPHHMTATVTVTFAAPKLCHVAQPAASSCGEVEVAHVDLALPEPELRQMQMVDVARWWPWPTPYADKYSRGVLGIDTGSDRFPGAAVLSVVGAVYSGAGMVRFVGPERPAALVTRRQPSVTLGNGPVQAWLAGSGWGEEASQERLQPILESGVPAVLDAEALNFLPDQLPGNCLLTPHAGELARMLGTSREEVTDDPIAAVREAAARWQATVLLKGSTQYVGEPSGRVTVAEAGPSWSAQAGSGDVLAGICGTLLSAGLPAWQAGAIAASVQALAANHRRGPYPPEENARFIPEVLDNLARIVGDQAIRMGRLTPSSIAEA
ncbi:MAG: bifunctional ADP-dependent NAD(P)H-hydrate dehydratase/NAD(P)H-hydrate epimerase [Brooklawnia sp.]